jgi:hypothetical protein
VLRELEATLKVNGSAQWAEQVGRSSVEVENSDYHGVERFLGLFGGMGSLNDVILVHNNQVLTSENDALDRLRNRAYGLAMALR